MHQIKACALLAMLFLSAQIYANEPDAIQLAVWTNEAIVATYTFNAQNSLVRQQEIAHYYTANGWINYSAALNASHLLDEVQKNNYSVTAVAMLPPDVKAVAAGQWEATMPLMVVYKNFQYQQKQTLQVTVDFTQVPEGQGVRGLAITRLQANTSQPACVCQ